MAEITASLVKELREKTGAGMMDCKKALGETAGDLEAAVDWLRTKGLAAAAKKSGRVAAEGLVGVVVSGKTGAALEVNAETDFVARNEQFQGFVLKATELALAVGGDVDALKTQAYPGGERNVGEELTNMIATIGENMNIRRAALISVEQGVVASYLHNSLSAGLGKIAVLVGLKSSGDVEKLNAFGKQLAMHVAAAAPISLTAAEIPAAVVEREKDVLREKARASGKPDNIIEKMLEGGLRKYYEQVTLLEQVYVIDGESKVKDAIAKFAKDLGAEVELTSFARVQLGEGIEKEQTDFAAEVAAQAKGQA